MTTPWEAFQRSMPPAPHIDIKKIGGNITDAEKQVNANFFAFFTTGAGRSQISSPFASEVGSRSKIVELNVWDNQTTGTAESEAVLEIEVIESMCNVYGTMHGGCAAYMLDNATLLTMILLGLAKGFDGTGVSQSMNINWHHPAPLGTTLTITGRSVFAEGRARLARCEMREKGSGKLIVFGSHAFLNAGRAVAKLRL
ncbi:HotDog domain-containing protein [Mycena latifolia]|nr:HotDog domain-containing protein [Mycena latifolia]